MNYLVKKVKQLFCSHDYYWVGFKEDKDITTVDYYHCFKCGKGKDVYR
jgi:hypothetical protein